MSEQIYETRHKKTRHEDDTEGCLEPRAEIAEDQELSDEIDRLLLEEKSGEAEMALDGIMLVLNEAAVRPETIQQSIDLAEEAARASEEFRYGNWLLTHAA